MLIVQEVNLTAELSRRGDYIQLSIQSIKLRRSFPRSSPTILFGVLSIRVRLNFGVFDFLF